MKQTKKIKIFLCGLISFVLMCFTAIGVFSNDVQTETADVLSNNLQTEELQTEVIQTAEESLITQSSINNPGNYTTLWENMMDYQLVERTTNDTIWIRAGGWAEFHVPVTEEGIYYLQIKSTGGSTYLRTELDNTYYAQLPVLQIEQFYKYNSYGDYEFVYFTPGVHSVILRNVGSTDCRVIDLEFKASQYAVDNGVTPALSDCKLYSGLNQPAHIHTHGINVTKSGANQTAVSGTDWHSSAEELQIHNEIAFVMEKNDWAKYEVVVPYTGIYQLDTRLGASSSAGHTDSEIVFYTQNGYKVSYPALMENGWEGIWQEGNYIYLEEGSNIIVAMNVGDDALALYTILLTELDNQGAEYEDLLLTNENEGLRISDLTLENQTATVYVFKAGNSYDITKLVIAEYSDDGEMTQVAVNTLPLEGQSIFTGAEYEVSLSETVTGTVKAFIATEDLIPYMGAVTE